MKRIFLIFLFSIFFIILTVLTNTYRKSSIQKEYPHQSGRELKTDSIENLKRAIQFKTISHDDPSKGNPLEFIRFHKFLEKTYPRAHRKMTKKLLVGYSLLFKWQGLNPKLKPIVLMAHQDVVPIEEGTAHLWTVNPFEGKIKDDFIWGRGAVDNKANLISIMEAVERLIGNNFEPERTVYLFFGHDEEASHDGAKAFSKLFSQEKIEAELVIDEGGIITKNQIPGMKQPVALIGTSEKGFLSLELSVRKNGGHSSMPDSETAIDILTKAIVKLRSKPFEPNFSPSVEGFIQHLGPEMSFVQRLAFANLWLFKPFVIKTYEKSAPGNAMIRTTVVPTIFTAGLKDNVVPSIAKATINFRLLPGDSTVFVRQKVIKLIGDERVDISDTRKTSTEPSKVTPVDSFAYRKVEESIKTVSADTLTSPFLMIGRTDSGYVGEVSNGIIKFSPIVDPVGYHGIDERLSLESYKTAIDFYEKLILNCQKE